MQLLYLFLFSNDAICASQQRFAIDRFRPLYISLETASYADVNSVQFLISAISDDLPSGMIRVPTPLVDAVRELSRLHRQGRTKAVLEGIQKVITAIDSTTVIDIDSVSESISKLTERLDRLEIQPIDSNPDIDIDSVIQMISGVSERLEKVESDLTAIALTIQDLSTRVSEVEGVGELQKNLIMQPIAEWLLTEANKPQEIEQWLAELLEQQSQASRQSGYTISNLQTILQMLTFSGGVKCTLKK